MPDIPFQIEFHSAREPHFIQKAKEPCQTAGDSPVPQKCQSFLKENIGYVKSLLTTSVTDGGENGALLLQLQSGDEVFLPSYKIASCAQAFVAHWASLTFADNAPGHPGIDVDQIEQLIDSQTEAILQTFYEGIACEVGEILDLAEHPNLVAIEDAAISIHIGYGNRAMERPGQIGTISLHLDT